MDRGQAAEHGQGKLYCCAIKDLFSNRIVGYALDERMTAQLALTALRTAVARRHRPASRWFTRTAGRNFDRGASVRS